MAYTPFLIADIAVGKELDKEPFLIPNDAFQVMENAYSWRGRIRKKYGHPLIGRLQRNFTAASIGVTAASPYSLNIFATVVPAITETEKMLVPGSLTVTIGAATISDALVIPKDGTMTSVTPGYSGVVNYTTGALTITHAAGLGVAVTLTFSYWPGLPAMGMANREVPAINYEECNVFDTKYAYQYSNTIKAFQEMPTLLLMNPTTWSGTNSDFFWSTNAFGALFTTNCKAGLHAYTVTTFAGAAAGPPPTVDITTSTAHNLTVGDQVMFINCTGVGAANNGLRGVVTSIAGAPFTATVSNIDSTTTIPIAWTNAGPITGLMIVSNQNLHGDGIRWHDGTSWRNFNPVLTPTTALMGSAMLFYYRDRLVCLDTIEGSDLTPTGTRYYQRARYSQNGTIYNITPVPSVSASGSAAYSADYQAWREDVTGRGGWIDAPTSERIVSAGFVKDTLIVFFERSTWRLRYTSNEILPFIWERINVEFGSSAPHSTVLFDAGPITVGQRGVIQTDGVQALRIDNIIPDEVFQFNNEQSGPQRIHGIREFEKQLVYWCFPQDAGNGPYPNRTLIYNYRDQSWGGPFRDTFTCFGTWQAADDLTWAGATMTWGDATFPWNANVGAAQYPTIIGGNQQGFVNKVNSTLVSANGETLQIKSITLGSPTYWRSKDHNLQTDDFIKLDGCIGLLTPPNGEIFKVKMIDADQIELYQYNPVTHGFTTAYELPAGTVYSGGGTLQRIDVPYIVTKKFNPSLAEGFGTRVGFIEFYLDAHADGEFICQIYIDDKNDQEINVPDSSNLRSNVVEMYPNPYEVVGEKLWHVLHNSAVGNMFQLVFTYSDDQTYDEAIATCDLVIHAINIWADRASKRLS